MTTNIDYSEVFPKMKQLWDLDFNVQANEGNEDYEEIEDFIATYNVGFPLSMLVCLDFVKYGGVTEEGLQAVLLTWDEAVSRGYIL